MNQQITSMPAAEDAIGFSRGHHLAYCDFLMAKQDEMQRRIAELTEKIDRLEKKKTLSWLDGAQRAELTQLRQGVDSLRKTFHELGAALRWANEFANI